VKHNTIGQIKVLILNNTNWKLCTFWYHLLYRHRTAWVQKHGTVPVRYGYLRSQKAIMFLSEELAEPGFRIHIYFMRIRIQGLKYMRIRIQGLFFPTIRVLYEKKKKKSLRTKARIRIKMRIWIRNPGRNLPGDGERTREWPASLRPFPPPPGGSSWVRAGLRHSCSAHRSAHSPATGPAGRPDTCNQCWGSESESKSGSERIRTF